MQWSSKLDNNSSILNVKDAKTNSWILLVLTSPAEHHQCPDGNLQDVQPTLGRLS